MEKLLLHNSSPVQHCGSSKCREEKQREVQGVSHTIRVFVAGGPETENCMEIKIEHNRVTSFLCV